jgi:phage terminase large subunit-like protein
MEMIYGSPTRMFICSLPRKNGKTSFSAMLLLLHLCGPEAKPNGQLYSAAQSRDQAAILFALAAKMVRMSPDLAQYVTIRDSRKELFCEEMGTLYRALSADASTAYGLSPTLVIHDELGQVRGPTSELFDALETASAAHESPMSIIISTQAPTDADLLSKLIDDARSKESDQATKCVLYAVPDAADPFDRDTLAAAQPNWHLMNHEEVFKMAEAARRMPTREASFRNLVANQRITLHNPFVSRSVWDSCGGAPDEDAFRQGPCFIGLDLSARNDLTALVMVAKDATGLWHVRPEFFTPGVGHVDRAKRDRVPYDVWAHEGLLHLTPGASVEYQYVAERLIDICDTYPVQAVAFDRWRIDVLLAELKRVGRELPMEPFGQGFKDMSPALEALETELVNARLRHGGHAILHNHAANAIAIRDPAGNRKLDKSKATGRIDGVVALAMAMGKAATVEGPAIIKQGFVVI